MKSHILFAALLLMVPASSQLASSAFSVGMSPGEFVMLPGEQRSGHVVATNSGTEPLLVKAYTGDWQITETGTMYSNPGTEPRSLSIWMDVRPSQVVIPPGASETIYYEITLPDDASLEGSYWGVVFVEKIPPASKESPDRKDQTRLKISTNIRYAADVFITIAGTEVRDASFTAANVSSADGGLDITATLENKSNIYLKPKVWLELFDSAGTKVLFKEHIERIVMPDAKRDYLFKLRDLHLESGAYNALIIADYGAANRIAAQLEIHIQ